MDSNGYPVVKDGVEQVYRIPGSVGPTKVVGIAEGCFEELVDYIVALKIDDDSQITTIGNSVFSGADALKYIYIGDSVQSIGDSAFSDCPELAIAEIGEGVTAIGANAFKGAKNLKKITIKSTVLKNVGKNAYKGIHKKAVIKVPKKQKKAYSRLFKKTGLASTVKIKA